MKMKYLRCLQTQLYTLRHFSWECTQALGDLNQIVFLRKRLSMWFHSKHNEYDWSGPLHGSCRWETSPSLTIGHLNASSHMTHKSADWFCYLNRMHRDSAFLDRCPVCECAYPMCIRLSLVFCTYKTSNPSINSSQNFPNFSNFWQVKVKLKPILHCHSLTLDDVHFSQKM